MDDNHTEADFCRLDCGKEQYAAEYACSRLGGKFQGSSRSCSPWLNSRLFDRHIVRSRLLVKSIRLAAIDQTGADYLLIAMQNASVPVEPSTITDLLEDRSPSIRLGV